MNRREFLKGTAFGLAGFAAARWRAALAHPAVGQAWGGWKPGEFQVHFIYTGIGEQQFLIFPDGTSMLLDCGDFRMGGRHAVPMLPSRGRRPGDWVARYVKRVNPHGDRVDYMLLSHFHNDHGGCLNAHAGMTKGRTPDYPLSGFAQAAEQLHFKTAIDRGWPDYNDPVKISDGIDGGVLRLMKSLYPYLASRDGLTVEKFRLGVADQIVQRSKNPVKGFTAFNFAANGRISSPETRVTTDLCAAIVKTHPKVLGENAMSLGTLFTYGKFRYYTAGDFCFTWKRPTDGRRFCFEADLAKIMPKVNVAKLNHHGHHTMPRELAAALDAQCYVAGVWHERHCTDDTMANLESVGRPHLYFPGFLPKLARNEDGTGKYPWTAKAAKPTWEGAHNVLSVAPGGDAYTMTCLTAKDESMQIKAVFDFKA